MTDVEAELWEIVKSKKCVEDSLAAELWCDWIRQEYDSWIQFFDYVISIIESRMTVKNVRRILNSSVYGDDYERFAKDWILGSDRKSYLKFVKGRTEHQ